MFQTICMTHFSWNFYKNIYFFGKMTNVYDNMGLYLQVTLLTQFLIDNCCKIFGEDMLNLFGDSDEDELSDNQGSFLSFCFLEPYTL